MKSLAFHEAGHRISLGLKFAAISACIGELTDSLKATIKVRAPLKGDGVTKIFKIAGLIEICEDTQAFTIDIFEGCALLVEGSEHIVCGVGSRCGCYSYRSQHKPK